MFELKDTADLARLSDPLAALRREHGLVVIDEVRTSSASQRPRDARAAVGGRDPPLATGKSLFSVARYQNAESAPLAPATPWVPSGDGRCRW